MRLLPLVLAVLPVTALADGGLTVPLPDLSGIPPAQAEELLRDLVTANVVSSNCPGYAITDGEWALLSQSADRIAYTILGLSVDDFDGRFYGPAFKLLDDPATCDARGPEVRGYLRLLQDMGGSIVPIDSAG